MKLIPKTGNGLIKAVAVPVMVAIILLFVTSAWQDYADVSYQLSAPDWAYPKQQAKIDFKIRNVGNIGIIPELSLVVENATIEKAEIPNVAEYQLPSYATYNSTYASFTNFELSPEWKELGVWSSVYIVPNEGVTSFRVSSTVNLPFDLMHLKNTVHFNPPREFIYTRSENGMFEKLK